MGGGRPGAVCALRKHPSLAMQSTVYTCTVPSGFVSGPSPEMRVLGVTVYSVCQWKHWGRHFKAAVCFRDSSCFGRSDPS